MSNLAPLQLSNVHPDFESLLAQLQMFLRQKATWQDTVESGGGEILLEAPAALAAFNQVGIELACRETFLESARRKSSIYAITRMLGVRIGRKTPAGVPVTLTRTSTSGALGIAPFTQFKIGSYYYFNRTTIVFADGVGSVDCTLYQGEIRTYSVVANVTKFREIYLPELDFAISDSDVYLSVLDSSTNLTTDWSLTFDGVWASGPTDNVFYDTTSPLGACIVTLGDGVHGALPPIGSQINITYAITKGTEPNNGTIGLGVKCLDSSVVVSGVTTGPIAGGSDERDYEFYRRTAPFIYRARKRAVTHQDYLAVIRDYPSVADVVVLGQKSIAPNDPRWMNLIRVCVLPKNSDSFTNTEWTDFMAYLDKFKQFTIDIDRKDPTVTWMDVTINVYCFYNQNLAVIKQYVINAVSALFTKRAGSLGRKLAVSDFDVAKIPNKVDYIDIISPTVDQLPTDTYTWLGLRSLTVNMAYTDRQNAL